jgi:predicted nuclease of predicted toxin-antitoxin system
VKWVADENVDHPIVARLRELGHDVWSVAEQASGLRDDEVLAHAEAAAAVLITSDKDFGELVFRQRRTTHGVVLVRLPGMGPVERAARVAAALAPILDQVYGNFTVIDRTGVRVRPA